MQVGGGRYEFPEKFDRQTYGIHFFILIQQHPDAGKYRNAPKI